jgi:hypothetical protein
VENHRIEAAAAPAPVCHHHPEGCPADCHCPKFAPENPGLENAGLADGTLSEPTLVQCTEGKAKALSAPALVPFWPPVFPDMFAVHASLPSWPSGSESLLDPPSDPPRHVPRSLSSFA